VEKPLVTTKPRENRLLLYLSATNLSGKREWKIYNLTMYYAFSTILGARVQFLTNHVAQFSDILHNLGGTNFTKNNPSSRIDQSKSMTVKIYDL
jgi:hypothetical protein